MQDEDRTHEDAQDSGPAGDDPDAQAAHGDDAENDAEYDAEYDVEGDGGDDEWATDTTGEYPGSEQGTASATWRQGLLVGVFVSGVVTGLIVVLAWGGFAGSEGEPAATDGADLAQTSELLDTGAAATPARSGATRLSRCTRAARSLKDPVEAARPAMKQWGVHVDAMNDLVVGEITLQQATEFWESTRVGAQRKVDGFRDAMATLKRQGLDCPSPEILAPGKRALRPCARQVEAEVSVLRGATTSVETWEEHIRHMDMLRLGDLSPEEATRMWLSMWQSGARDLEAYRAMAREAERFSGCDFVASAG